MKDYSLYKRFLDLIGIFALIPFLLLIFSMVFIFQKITVKSSCFFLQERIGKSGNIFRIYKFRTLENDCDVSKWSAYLRWTHLDEIPQILNIIKGEMSFVGPRPLLKEYHPYFTAIELDRFKLKPGLTGLAQVSGGNDLSWSKRLELDVHYIDNFSFLMDLKIIIKTFKILFKFERSESVSLIEERGRFKKLYYNTSECIRITE